MPASDTRDDQRGARVYSVLFWVGVALAPLAALMLVVSSGTGGLKTALGVVIISVILIGVSITMRRDADGLRGELEETVFDEIDALRADVRADITQAAQATHRAFGEKMQFLLDQIETTRAELEATRFQVDALRHGMAAPPTTTQRHTAAASSSSAVPQASGRAGMASGMSSGMAPGMAPGVVRHTETVQVTTRHTVMDPHDDGQRGTTYSSHSSHSVPPRRGDEAWAPPESRLREDPWADPPRPREESWTEQRLREQFDRMREEREDRWQPRESSQPSASSQPSQSSPQSQSTQDDDRWPDMRAGDRWASVRSDERGRELRMGERRAAVHSDSSGTELRIEDRWAAVRRDAGLAGGDWRLDTPRGDFPYRDHDDRRAITGSDREERWSDYHRDHERDRGRDYDRERDRDYERDRDRDYERDRGRDYDRDYERERRYR